MPKKIEPEKTEKFESESSEEEESSEGEGEGEEEEEGESGSETESEHEQLQINQKTQSLPDAAVKKVGIEPSSSSKAQNKPESSSSGEEDESESESEGAEADVVPLAAKRAEAPEKSGSAGGNRIPKALEHAILPKTAGGKRTTEGLDTKGGKKAKKADQGISHGEPEATSSKKKLELSPKGEKSINDDIKKQLFQRIWSEDDEIVVLKGMVDYAEKKKSDPVLDLDSFHEFIKDNLHVDVSRTQLQDKIRRLKKKYLNNKNKEVEGTDRIFAKPHEQQTYELSKEVWGKKSAESVVGSPKSKSSVARKRQIKTKTENRNHGKSGETKMEKGKSEDINLENGKSEEDTKMENGKSEDINMVDLANGDADTEVRMLEIASGDADTEVRMLKIASGDADTEVRMLGIASGDTDSIVPPSFQNMDMESRIMSIGTKLYGGNGIVQGTKEWSQLALEEIELYDKKLALMSARAKLVINGLKSRNL